MWVIWLKLTPVNSCELHWKKKQHLHALCVCVFLQPYIKLIFTPVAYRVGCRVQPFVLAELRQHVLALFFSSRFSFPAWVFPSLALLFCNQLLRQTLADTCLCFYCVWMLCFLNTSISISLAPSNPLQPHNMMQGRAQKIATCKHLLHEHF